jgi:hypothetical protein
VLSAEAFKTEMLIEQAAHSLTAGCNESEHTASAAYKEASFRQHERFRNNGQSCQVNLEKETLC